MRRRPGTLLAIEVEILTAALAAMGSGDGWIHGFAMAKLLRDQADAGRLTSHGTLYKALGRLADAGLLVDEWEDADAALQEGRPRRRLYRISGNGERALAKARAEGADPAGGMASRIAPA